MSLPHTLKATMLSGLSKKEIENSRKKYGSNELKKIENKSFFSKYLESFADPMVRILLVALGINLIFLLRTLDWYEPLGIALSIFIATMISTLSEHGSQSAFEKLQSEAAKIRTKVIREGKISEIPIDEIVVGDLVVLQAGDMIPADGIIISGKMEVNQSALNGETKESQKFPLKGGDMPDDLMSQMGLFRGSIVNGGEGTLLVKLVGDNTFYGKMAKEVQGDTRESPMKLRLMQLADTISKIGYTGAILVSVAYIFRILLMDFNLNFTLFANHYKDLKFLLPELLNIIMLSVTVVVVAVPEGLPMMITVVLSANMKKMLNSGVLVRKMLGIETAGSMNILFTDKTGTLTKGKLAVNEVILGNGKSYTSAKQIKNNVEFWQHFQISSVLNNGAYMSYEANLKKAIGGNSTDRAILNFVEDQRLSSSIPVICKQPFNSNFKFSAVTVGGKTPLTYIKGAPEKLLPLCTHYYDQAGNRLPFTDKTSLYNRQRLLQQNAIRLLVMAVSETLQCEGIPEQLTLLCVVGIKDELRPESRPSIQKLKQAGIKVVMVTGDGIETATAIAKECGISDSPSDIIIDSKELSKLSDSDIEARLDSIKVVARALPSDKSRLVRIAQKKGLVCGMTGDGINDAPALKAADVGFSMGSGSDVAKEASDIVILDDNIQSITKAVLYGRTIFKSIRKFVIYQLTVNLCAVGLSVIAPFMGIETPVTIMQMLWINMVMDTLGGLAFSGEPTRESYMREKPKQREERILNKYMLSQVIWTGCYTLLLCLMFIKLPFLHNFIRPHENDIYLMTALFALFMYAAIFNSLNARTHNINLSSYISRNKPFILIMSIVFLVQGLMIYLGGTVFRTSGLNVKEFILVLLLAFTVIPADLLRKYFLLKNKKLRGV